MDENNEKRVTMETCASLKRVTPTHLILPTRANLTNHIFQQINHFEEGGTSVVTETVEKTLFPLIHAIVENKQPFPRVQQTSSGSVELMWEGNGGEFELRVDSDGSWTVSGQESFFAESHGQAGVKSYSWGTQPPIEIKNLFGLDEDSLNIIKEVRERLNKLGTTLQMFPLPKPVPLTVCNTCGFDLFIPLIQLETSMLGLYDDARWPGRCILAWNVNHIDYVDEIPSRFAQRWWGDLTTTTKILRAVTNAERINVAILGNTINHLHAHLIPRYPLQEKYPTRPSWEDPRPHETLSLEQREQLREEITNAFQSRQSLKGDLISL